MSDVMTLAPLLGHRDQQWHQWSEEYPAVPPKPTKQEKAAKTWSVLAPFYDSAADSLLVSGCPDPEEHLQKTLLIAYMDKGVVQALRGQSEMRFDPFVESKLSEDLLLENWTLNPIYEAEEEAIDVSLMKEFGLAGIAGIFCAIPLIALSPAIGIAGMFIGSAIFWLANYASYRTGQEGWVVGPAGAAKLFAGSLLLAVTAIVAAVTS